MMYINSMFFSLCLTIKGIHRSEQAIHYTEALMDSSSLLQCIGIYFASFLWWACAFQWSAIAYIFVGKMLILVLYLRFFACHGGSLHHLCILPPKMVAYLLYFVQAGGLWPVPGLLWPFRQEGWKFPRNRVPCIPSKSLAFCRCKPLVQKCSTSMQI